MGIEMGVTLGRDVACNMQRLYDKYLEAPNLWPYVHNRLSFAICDKIQPSLDLHYVAVLTPYFEQESIQVSTSRTICTRSIFQRDEQVYAVSATAVGCVFLSLLSLVWLPMR